ncbi:hypothetical protein TNCV_2326201 [Trichonephila clavipes]|nr:hypothetical protein TNCV_2326201 [Trichonephila clavipes]
MTGTLPPLLESVVGGGTPEDEVCFALMDPMKLCRKDLVLGMYPLSMIFGSSGPGKALSQEIYGPTKHGRWSGQRLETTFLRPRYNGPVPKVMAGREQFLFIAAALSSDEAHFWLNGYVNKQNCSIWSEANPQVYVETPLHPEKLTVWCALWAGGILLQKR